MNKVGKCYRNDKLILQVNNPEKYKTMNAELQEADEFWSKWETERLEKLDSEHNATLVKNVVAKEVN